MSVNRRGSGICKSREQRYWPRLAPTEAGSASDSRVLTREQAAIKDDGVGVLGIGYEAACKWAKLEPGLYSSAGWPPLTFGRLVCVMEAGRWSGSGLDRRGLVSCLLD
jgi:hypothetical protein